MTLVVSNSPVRGLNQYAAGSPVTTLVSTEKPSVDLPVELENALLGHPEVEDAVVVAVPDPTWVERPVACVVAAGNVTGDDLRSHLADRFPRFWVPDTVLFVETIPRTSVGKLDKKRVRAELGITDDTAPVTS